ncbi:MAG: hypothetical protein GYB65_18220 [Chloroflexi bacterium]|nr:hypothetical protein [Chloroflexota bacterium]
MMKHTGTVVRVQRNRDGVVLVLETDMGPRGVQLDKAAWLAMCQDFPDGPKTDIIGWPVEYNPATGDLELTVPGGDGDEDEDKAEADDQSG